MSGAEEDGAWRAIGPDEVLPPGCHVQIDMTTGTKVVWEPAGTPQQSQPADRSNGQAPPQDAAEPKGTEGATNGPASGSESEAAETEQAAAAVPINDTQKAPRSQPSRKRSNKRKVAAEKGNGVAGAGVDAVERAATIKRLVELVDDAEYDAQVTPEARRIGVKVRTINKRRAAHKKANAHQVDAAEVQAAIARLLNLPPPEYAIRLKPEADSLDIAAKELRTLVEAERQRLRAEAEVKEREAAGFDVSSQPPPGARPRRKPDAAGVIWPDGFAMKETGLWFQPPPDGKDDVPDPVWISAPFQIAAGTNDDADQSFGLQLRWTDCNAREHEWAMPLRMVHTDGNPIAVELQDAGLSCGTSRKAHDGLKHFLGAVRSIHRVRCVERAGWHGTAYVLPNGKIFGADGSGRLVLQSEHAATAGTYAARGTLVEWQDRLARPAVGNDLAVLTTSASFAGPLLDVMGEVSGGIHLCGGSQTGKTTLMCTAASVYGPGDSKTGPIRSWRSTANGMEAVAAEHSDGLLILDEIGQANGREVGEVVYMLSNQRGKARMGRAGGARRLSTWRLIYLSTGETPLATKMNEAGQRPYAGQEVRLLNISADAGAGLGVFQKLHDAASAGAFSEQLRRAAVSCYGTAGPAFLEALVRDRAKDPEKLENSLRQGREKFLAANVPEGADGQVRSAAARFALMGMAGELARSYGVLPWDEGMAMHAAAACFRSWLAGRGGEGAAEDRQAIDVVKLFIALHGNSRFESLDQKEEVQRRDMDDPYPGPMGGAERKPPLEPRIINRAGYVRTVEGGKEFLFHVPVWRDEVFKGMDAGRAAKAIFNAGFLLPGKQNMSTIEWIPGTGSARVYVVSSAILG